MRTYEDIIHLPHHQSRKHPPMPLLNRAAQFAPFAALTGYDAAVTETRRATEARIELDEDERYTLSMQLRQIAALRDMHPEVRITCFQPDERKAGGTYVTVTGRVQRMEAYERRIRLESGQSIPFDDVYAVECPCLDTQLTEAEVV